MGNGFTWRSLQVERETNTHVGSKTGKLKVVSESESVKARGAWLEETPAMLKNKYNKNK